MPRPGRPQSSAPALRRRHRAPRRRSRKACEAGIPCGPAWTPAGACLSARPVSTAVHPRSFRADELAGRRLTSSSSLSCSSAPAAVSGSMPLSASSRRRARLGQLARPGLLGPTTCRRIRVVDQPHFLEAVQHGLGDVLGDVALGQFVARAAAGSGRMRSAGAARWRATVVRVRLPVLLGGIRAGLAGPRRRRTPSSHRRQKSTGPRAAASLGRLVDLSAPTPSFSLISFSSSSARSGLSRRNGGRSPCPGRAGRRRR